jgi:4-amino-4-deoxy-L-arabinose transferase-like glycosyltransferase
LVAIVALAAALRFWALGHQGFWFDEAVTARLLRGSAGQMLTALPHTESTPPLYYLIAWGWVRLFGNDEIGLRSLSALAGVAAVPVTYAAASVLSGRRVGLLAALIVGVNPLLIWYSQEGRSYSLLVFLCATSYWLFARARAAPTRSRLLLWAAASALALCTHYFAVFVILPEAFLLLADRRAGLRLRLAAVVSIGGVVALLAALAASQSHRHHYYFADIPLGIRLEQVARSFTVGFAPPADKTPAVLAGLVLIAALAMLLGRGAPAERRSALLAGSVGGFAIVVPVALAVVGIDFVNSRNLIGALVPLAVAIAGGLGARRAGHIGLAAAVALTAISIAMIGALQGDPSAQRPRWRQVSAVLGSPTVARAILLDGRRSWGPIIGFYLPPSRWMPVKGAPVEEIDVLRKIPARTDCPVATWWGPLCGVRAAPALKAPPVPGIRLVSTRRVAGFEVARYRVPLPIHIYPSRPYTDATRIHAAHPGASHMLFSPAPRARVSSRAEYVPG